METIQCHHNYTEQMSGDLMRHWRARSRGHAGHVWLSRKGAIDASEGKPGLIPGSMGTRSYVVTGKGNKLSLNSSPHGAGREYSRSAARRTFTRAQLDKAMEGIEWRHTDAFLDEIPGAYKDIDSRDGGRRRPSGDPAHAAADRQRQGRVRSSGAFLS